MAGTIKRTFGPVALANGGSPNIYNQGSALIYDVITHIAIVNKTAGAITFSLYLGATGGAAAGTEVIGTATSVAANTTFHWYGRMKMTSTDFLTGSASGAASLTITGEGDQYVV